MENNLKIIGQRIRDERNKHKWLISELSDCTGLSVGYISSIERGKCNFSIESLMSISNALEVNVNYLLFGELKINLDIPIDFQKVIGDCNQHEVNILVQNAQSLKAILRNSNII